MEDVAVVRLRERHMAEVKALRARQESEARMMEDAGVASEAALASGDRPHAHPEGWLLSDHSKGPLSRQPDPYAPACYDVLSKSHVTSIRTSEDAQY